MKKLGYVILLLLMSVPCFAEMNVYIGITEGNCPICHYGLLTGFIDMVKHEIPQCKINFIFPTNDTAMVKKLADGFPKETKMIFGSEGKTLYKFFSSEDADEPFAAAVMDDGAIRKSMIDSKYPDVIKSFKNYQPVKISDPAELNFDAPVGNVAAADMINNNLISLVNTGSQIFVFDRNKNRIINGEIPDSVFYFLQDATSMKNISFAEKYNGKRGVLLMRGGPEIYEKDGRITYLGTYFWNMIDTIEYDEEIKQNVTTHRTTCSMYSPFIYNYITNEYRIDTNSKFHNMIGSNGFTFHVKLIAGKYYVSLWQMHPFDMTDKQEIDFARVFDSDFNLIEKISNKKVKRYVDSDSFKALAASYDPIPNSSECFLKLSNNNYMQLFVKNGLKYRKLGFGGALKWNLINDDEKNTVDEFTDLNYGELYYQDLKVFANKFLSAQCYKLKDKYYGYLQINDYEKGLEQEIPVIINCSFSNLAILTYNGNSAELLYKNKDNGKFYTLKVSV